MDKLVHKHQRILNQVEASVQKPMSAGELYQHIYNLVDYVHHHRVVMGETLGYLNYLVNNNRLSMDINNGRVIYKPLE